MALTMEQHFSKRTILELYVNSIYLRRRLRGHRQCELGLFRQSPQRARCRRNARCWPASRTRRACTRCLRTLASRARAPAGSVAEARILRLPRAGRSTAHSGKPARAGRMTRRPIDPLARRTPASERCHALHAGSVVVVAPTGFARTDDGGFGRISRMKRFKTTVAGRPDRRRPAGIARLHGGMRPEDAAEPAAQAYVSPYDWSGLERSGDRLAFRENGEVRSPVRRGRVRPSRRHRLERCGERRRGPSPSCAWATAATPRARCTPIPDTPRISTMRRARASDVGAYFFSASRQRRRGARRSRVRAAACWAGRLPGAARGVRPRARRRRARVDANNMRPRNAHRVRAGVLRNASSRAATRR